MDEEDGEAMAALQLAQVGQQWGDLAAGVLVDAMQAHERIENEQKRLEGGYGGGEAAPIGLQIEPERWGGDDLDIEIGERHTSRGGDALEASAHDRRGILG